MAGIYTEPSGTPVVFFIHRSIPGCAILRKKCLLVVLAAKALEEGPTVRAGGAVERSGVEPEGVAHRPLEGVWLDRGELL